MSRFREGKLTADQLEIFLTQMFAKGRRVGYSFDTEDELTWVYINAGANGLCLRSDGCSSGLLNGHYGSDCLCKGDEQTIDLNYIRVPHPWVVKLMDKFMPGGGARARKEEVEAAIQGIISPTKTGGIKEQGSDIQAKLVVSVVLIILAALAFLAVR